MDTIAVTAPVPAGTRAIAVFDVDGTLADARHRLHWIIGKPTHADWVAFFDAAENDPPVPEGVALARRLAAGLDIAYVTARPERIHGLTAHWLTAQGLPEGSLQMKAADDRRPAREMKLAAIRELEATGRRIERVVDDDPRVTHLLQAHGYTTQLAQWIPWAPVLGRQ